jgi:hypothetical protein
MRRYRHWYAKLLRLYPKPYYERFGEGMEQTFNDLLRERAEEKRGLRWSPKFGQVAKRESRS